MTQTKTKKLIVWCQFFYPELISTGQVVTELFESFSKSIDIHVLCAQPTIVKADKIPLILIHSNIKVERVWSTCFSKLSLTGKICNQLTYACSLFWKSLTLPNRSHVNVFTDPFFLPLLLYFLHPIKKFRYTITIFDLYPETLSQHKILSKKSIIYRVLDNMTNKVYANAYKVITIGRCMQKIVSSRSIKWKRKPVFIPIWCDTDNIKNPSKSYDLRRNFNLGHDSFIVGYSGNLAKFHPIEIFTEAAFLLRNYEEIKFVFLGEGAKKSNAEKFCFDKRLKNCFFESYVMREQLGSLLSCFDCGLVGLNENQTGLSVPSKTIGLMSAGVPILACVSDQSETALMIKENKCGLIIPPNCSRSLADAILSLQQNKKKCDEYRQNALSAVAESLNIESISKAYFNFLFQP